MTSSAGSLVELRAEPGGGAAVEDETERLALELGQHGGALLGGQRLEERQAVLARKVVEKLGEVRGVDVRDRGGKLPRVLANELGDVGPDDLGERHARGIVSVRRSCEQVYDVGLFVGSTQSELPSG